MAEDSEDILVKVVLTQLVWSSSLAPW